MKKISRHMNQMSPLKGNFFRAINNRKLVMGVFFVIFPTFLVWLMVVNNDSHLRSRNSTDTTAISISDLNTTKFRTLTLWTSDFHISPVADVKNILNTYFQTKVIDKSLSGHCHLSNTCERDLRVMNKQNGINLGVCPNLLIKEFFNSYKHDPVMNDVDAYLCTYANSMCEVFMPFNKPLIVIAATRYETGRHEPERWKQWNENLQKIASSAFNFVGANNRYDQEYIKYFTNIRDVKLIPSYCGYITETYRPTRQEVLIAPSRGVNMNVAALYNSNKSFQLGGAVKRNISTVINPERPLTLAHIRDIYPTFQYSDLVAHPAIVLLPYQFYRMEIPLFVPTPELLTDWQLRYRMLNERSWNSVFGKPKRNSDIPKHPQSSSKMKFDPNNDFDKDAILEWITLADFYQWPHVTRFESFEELFTLLESKDLILISKNMKDNNKIELEKVTVGWQEILDRVFRVKTLRRTCPNFSISENSCNSSTKSFDLKYTNKVQQSPTISNLESNENVDDALRKAYHLELNSGCFGFRDIDVHK